MKSSRVYYIVYLYRKHMPMVIYTTLKRQLATQYYTYPVRCRWKHNTTLTRLDATDNTILHITVTHGERIDIHNNDTNDGPTHLDKNVC